MTYHTGDTIEKNIEDDRMDNGRMVPRKKSPAAYIAGAALSVSLLLSSAGCTPMTSPPRPDLNQIVQQTIQAMQIEQLKTQVAQIQAEQQANQQPPLPTATPQPTATLQPTATPNPTATLQPWIQPMIYADANTNCRSGPGIVYDVIGAFMDGEDAKMYGRLADNSWFLIESTYPYNSSTQCWVWDGSTHTSGDISLLPVLTPPPTPTPLPTPAYKTKKLSLEIVPSLTGHVKENGPYGETLRVGDNAENVDMQSFLTFAMDDLPKKAKIDYVGLEFDKEKINGEPFKGDCLYVVFDRETSLDSGSYVKGFDPTDDRYLQAICSWTDPAWGDPIDGYDITHLFRKEFGNDHKGYFQVRLQMGHEKIKKQADNVIIDPDSVKLIVKYHLE